MFQNHISDRHWQLLLQTCPQAFLLYRQPISTHIKKGSSDGIAKSGKTDKLFRKFMPQLQNVQIISLTKCKLILCTIFSFLFS